jgi:hypothetical protein
MTITDRPVDNGVNVGALLEARTALSAAPEAAQFTWRASCTWRNGTHSHSTVTGFSGLGGEQQHRTPNASPRKTTAPRRWSSCWSAWPGA